MTSALYDVRNTVRDLRSSKGLSQEQLGAALGVSRQTINATETERYVLILLGLRSETYRGLTEEPDERFALIGQRAWAGTGVVLTLGNLGALIGDLASGRSGDPYYWLVGTAAIAYIAFIGHVRHLT